MTNLLRLASKLMALAAIVAPPFLGTGARADAVADFYTGKTMIIIVGADTGGGYDAQARLMSRHLGRFIPGQPSLIVQNMPGAGSLIAANNLYNTAAKDGTVIGLLQRGVLSSKFTNPSGVRFDLAKFNWVGNLSAETAVVVAWHTTPFKSLQDVLNQEMLVAGTGPTIDTETTPRLLNALIGTKFKVISGYPSSGPAMLAMERGEVDGAATSWAAVKSTKQQWLQEKKAKIILQDVPERAPDLPDVPAIVELGKTPEDKQILTLYASGGAIGRSVLAPPDLPASVTKVLRDGFAAMLGDKEFQADLNKASLDLEPGKAEDLQRVVDETVKVPDSVRERVRSIFKRN